MITLGLEEELHVVSATDFALVPHDVDAGKAAIPDSNGTSSCEIHQCVLEVQTPVCSSLDALMASLANMRSIAAARAARNEHLVLSAGLHPFSDWRKQALHDDAQEHQHYHRLLTEYVDVARGAMSCGMHMHFGLSDPESRVEILNRLRERLPGVLALSVSAPYMDGRDTGMQSWRHSQLDLYPRMGTPGIWASDDDYFAHIERLRKVGILSATQGVWEDLRIHHEYRTLEVRICDATPDLDRVWLIAALLLCEVQTLEAEVRNGQAQPPIPSSLIAENRWRARRHGLSAQFVDWHKDETLNTAEHFRRWLDRLTPAAEALGLLPRLEQAMDRALQQGTSADKQRAIVRAGGSLQDVVSALVLETAKPMTRALWEKGA